MSEAKRLLLGAQEGARHALESLKEGRVMGPSQNVVFNQRVDCGYLVAEKGDERRVSEKDIQHIRKVFGDEAITVEGGEAPAPAPAEADEDSPTEGRETPGAPPARNKRQPRKGTASK